MKRASYRAGVRWIAENDNSAEADDIETIAGYVSTLLLADLFDVDEERVARDIKAVRVREKIGAHRWA